jgi:hypothetical protein
MLSQTLQLMPYIAIASAALLGGTIAAICYSQLYRRSGLDVRRPSILSFFPKWPTAVIGPGRARLGIIIHDPDASKPHDLDDPFLDPKVRERVGAVIADAARTKVKS